MANVTLYTIHPKEVWDALRRDGVLYGEASRVNKEFGFAQYYRWMMHQMKKRIPGYQGGHPIWAWLENKPDFEEYAGYVAPGEPGVCMCVIVPRARVLLSDYISWSIIVLNDGYIGLTEDEEDRWYEEPESTGKRLSQYRSWERVFDIDFVRKRYEISDSDATQACLEYIRLEEVVSVEHFSGRRE